MKNPLWVSDNSEVDHRYRTKISKDVSNPGNFAGEPPQIAAQPPPAVAKFISKPLNYFPLYLFLFIILCCILINYSVIIIFYYFYFCWHFILLTVDSFYCCWHNFCFIFGWLVDYLWLSFSGQIAGLSTSCSSCHSSSCFYNLPIQQSIYKAC